MLIRRMMMIGLTNYIRNTIDVFRSGITSLYPVYEAEDYLYSNLDTLNNINLLGDATLIITPNAYNEEVLHTVKGNTITTSFNNLGRYTESSTGWVASQLLLSNTTTINPFGLTANVVSIQETAVANSHFTTNTPSVIIISGRIYTFSVYMKKGVGVTAPDIMQISAIAGFAANYANFDINTGSVTATSGCTATIDNTGLSSGWWRCSVTLTATSTIASTWRIYFCNNNPTATLATSYLGVTTTNIIFTGYQIEEGSSVTTYQPIIFTQNLQKGYLEHTRSTTAYRKEGSGLVREVPQENLFPASENMLLTNYSKTNLTIISNTEPSPIASSIPMLLNDGVAFGRRRVACTAATSISIGDTLILSVYAKKAQHDWIQLCPVNINYESNDWANFNLDTGTIGNKGVDATAYIESVGNGWYRCSLLCRVVGEVLQQIDVCQSIGNIDSGRYPNHTGTGQDVFYICGASLTRGSTVKPYFPTLSRINTPRIDYEEGEPVLLLEQSNSNGILRSEEFDNASWIKSNILTATNSFIAPNGLMVADTITATATNGYITQNSAVFSSNLAGVGSVWLKRKTGTGDITLEVGRTIATASISTNSWTRVNVVDTALSATYSISGGTHSLTTSVNHNLNTGDSIRFGVLTGPGTTTNAMIATVTGPNTFTYFVGTASGSGTATLYARFIRIKLATSGDEVYAWGAQYEITSSVITSGYYQPTSYIPTTTSTTTRTADTMSISKNNLLSNNYSLFYEVKKIGGGSSQDYHIALTDVPGGFTSNSILINGLPLGARKMDGGVNTTLTVGGYTPVNNTYYKGLITCNNGVFDIWLDGVKVVTTTMVNHQLATHLSLSGINNGMAKFKRVYGWNRVLNRAEIDSLFSFVYYNSGYTPVNYELQQVINRAYYEGFTLPSNTTLGYCDSLITSMKNDGSWSITDMFFNFAYNDTSLTNFSRINWKNPNSKLNGICVLNGGLTYQLDGFKGNAVDGYIDTLFNPSSTPYNYTLNNAGRMFVVSQDQTTTTYYEGNTSNNQNCTIKNNSTLVARINASVNLLGAAFDMSGTGLKSVMRDSSTNVRIQNGVNTLSTTQTSVSITTLNQLLFRGGTNYNDACITTYWLGASLNNTQVSNFRTNYNTFLTNVGLTAFA